MSNLDLIITKAKKQLGSNTFDEIDDFSEVGFWVSSGVPELDVFLNTFGYNPGIMEVCGKSRSGKTTLGLHLIEQTLKVKGIPLLVSTERRDNKNYAKSMNINTNNVLLKKVKNMEAAFDTIDEHIDLIRNEDETIPISIILDSLGGTPTKAEMEAKKDQEFMAVAARVIKGRLRRMTQKIDDGKTLFFIINQTYDKVGQTFGKKSTSYGGDGVKFHSQLRMEAVKIKTIKANKDKKVGQVTKIELLKTDFGLPEQEINLEMLWGFGYIPSIQFLDVATEYGILEKYKNGSKFSSKFQWSKRDDFYNLYGSEKVFRLLLNKELKAMAIKTVKDKRGMK
jgi:recombination protein RecA